MFSGTVVVGIPVTAFIKDGLNWMGQIKSCPKWMWKAALMLGVYGICLVCLMIILPEGPSLSDQHLTLSGFPLAFDAIFLCVLSSVLWSGYLEESEVIRRALLSLLFVTVGVAAFLAYRAGYLRHPNRY